MKDWWNKVVRDYFVFRAGERNGVVALCVLLLLVIFYPQIISLFKKDTPEDFRQFKIEVDSFHARMKNAEADSIADQPSLADLDKKTSAERSVVIPVQLFSFNPNTATADDFQKLGLKDRLIKTILNYRAKGGKFFVKEDFKKMYGLSENEYNRLEPYIQIADQKKKYDEQPKKPFAATNNSSPASLLDLNRADSTQLDALPMIGPVLSSRIIKFRDKLGGFYSVDQLMDIYGISPETFDAIKEKISVNATDIKKININSISLDDLKQHPYFRTVAKVLISYRDQHGDFKTIEDLREIDVITEEAYQKMIPYIQL